MANVDMGPEKGAQRELARLRAVTPVTTTVRVDPSATVSLVASVETATAVASTVVATLAASAVVPAEGSGVKRPTSSH